MYEEERVLRLPDVRAVTGLSSSTIYALMANNDFPPSISLGGKRRGWLTSEVQAWIAQRRRMRDEAEVANAAA